MIAAPSARRRGPGLRHLGILLALVLPVAPVIAAQPGTTADGEWKRMPIEPGKPVTTRPFPPASGRNRCVSIDNVAGAQLFGDRGIELTTKTGDRYRLFLAQECPALSFYQGFYYRRQRAGQLCAGRDVVGARSGGECLIASIIKVRPVGQSAKPKRR
jgi:hypothetical protein